MTANMHLQDGADCSKAQLAAQAAAGRPAILGVIRWQRRRH